MRVIIVGAGLSGLTLAAFLRRVNVDVVVLEQASRLNARHVPPHTFYAGALSCYAAFGLARMLDDPLLTPEASYQIVNAQRRCLLRCRNRVVSVRGVDDEVSLAPLRPLPPTANDDSIASLRAREAMARHVTRLPLRLTAQAAPVHAWLRRHLVDVRYGCRVVDLLPHDSVTGGVRVVTESGNAEWGDVVVGADGVHSTVRRLLYPAEAHDDGGGGGRRVLSDVLCVHGVAAATSPLRGVDDGPVTLLRGGADACAFAASSSPSPRPSSCSPLCALTLTPHAHQGEACMSFTALMTRRRRRSRRGRAWDFTGSSNTSRLLTSSSRGRGDDGAGGTRPAAAATAADAHDTLGGDDDDAAAAAAAVGSGKGDSAAGAADDDSDIDDPEDRYADALALLEDGDDAERLSRHCRATLARDARVFGDDVAALLARATVAVAEVPREVPILPRWYNKRAVLLGDAAHGTAPSLLGGDASMCVEDAALLATALLDVPLRRDTGFAYAFGRYEAARRPRVERYTRHARRIRRIATSRHTTLRDALLRATPSCAVDALLQRWLHTWTYNAYALRAPGELHTDTAYSA